MNRHDNCGDTGRIADEIIRLTYTDVLNFADGLVQYMSNGRGGLSNTPEMAAILTRWAENHPVDEPDEVYPETSLARVLRGMAPAEVPVDGEPVA